MGYGGYDLNARTVRATSLGFFDKSAGEIFKSRKIQSAMNPEGIIVRESRDSEEHPNSLAIVVALDVTGSMGKIPHQLVKEGLPKMMTGIIQHGEKDPQVLLLGIGDHKCDSSPLQVGQFETSDEKLDKWLTDIYIEGGGGANAGESYLLAWYFAGNHTSIDCMEKHNRKGILFTIGDEPTLHEINKNDLRRIMGDGEYPNSITVTELLEKAQQKYDLYHIHVTETAQGSRPETLMGWKNLLGENVLVVNDHRNIANVIAETVVKFKKFDQQAPAIIAAVSTEPKTNIPAML